jgi:hypothetical protein
VPLVREGIEYPYEPRSGPAALTFAEWLLFGSPGEEPEQCRLELDQGGLVFLGDYANWSICFQVLALSFEDYSAFLEGRGIG